MFLAQLQFGAELGGQMGFGNIPESEKPERKSFFDNRLTK